MNSTRIENLSLEPDGAKFVLDGRAVRIAREASAPSVKALQAFYQSALADYQAQTPATASPGWFSQIKSWFGRILDLRWNGLSPSRCSSPGAEAVPHRPAPALRTAFGDRDGVHLSWQVPPNAGVHTLNYPLDSVLADRLQDCYGHLAELGYKVVGLDLLKAPPEKRPSAHRAEQRVGDIALHLPTPPDAPPVSRPPRTVAAASADKKERTVVLRVDHDRSEPAHATPTAPPKEIEKTPVAPVLAAPEQLMRALKVAADPERPVEDRLTFLRCSLGKEGLKIVDVGLGQDKEHGPARWEEASKWLARQAEPEPPRKRTHPAPEAVTAAGRTQGPEPDI